MNMIAATVPTLAVASPSIAMQSSEPSAAASEQNDPIFAAIERHRAAYLAYRSRVEFENNEEKAGRPISSCRGWTAEMQCAMDDLSRAADELACTAPATPAGLVALTSYAHDPADEKGFLFYSSGEADERVVRKFVASMKAAAARLAGALLSGGAPVHIQRDPIFDAIARHRHAAQRVCAAMNWREDLEKTLPAGARQGDAYETGIEHDEDDPRWNECARALRAADEAVEDAAIDILNTEPTTHAGIVALLMYGFEHGGADSWSVPQGVGFTGEDGSDAGATWMEHVLVHAAESLASLADCAVPQVTKRSFERGYAPLAEDAPHAPVEC